MEQNNFGKYRLINQKQNGFGGLYKKLFEILEIESIFIECAEESSYFDGNDLIIETTWKHNPSIKLPKGIIDLNK